jgi:hypothetical protein
MLGILEGQLASLHTQNQALGTVSALDELKEGRVLQQAMSFLDPDNIPESLLEENPAYMDWNLYSQQE